MGTPSSDNLMLGAGVIFFDREDASGNKTGERHLGNCTSFSLTTEVEKVEKFSAMNKAKRLYKSVVKSIKATGKITLDEYDPANMALALLGSEGTVTQSSGAISTTPEAIVAKPGYAAKLNYFAVSDLVIKSSDGTTTYTENTDYIIQNAKAGVIFFPAGTTIVSGTTVKATYSYAAATIPKIIGANVGKIEGYLRFVGDPTSGPAYLGDFWNVSISPDGELGFITDDWGSFSLNFECQDDTTNHPTDPFYRLLKL